MPRRVKNVFVVVVYLILFSEVELAQDTTYSTDSLMAAFNKGSHASLKGSEIAVTGVVAEIKKSRVVFKSLGNDKVICELASSIAIEEHPVGSSLTVMGKVRGRGMLGNVTLDQCNLAPSNIASTQPASIEAPIEPSVEPITEVEETTAGVADAVPAKPNLPPGSAQSPKTPMTGAATKTAAANEPAESNPRIETSERPDKIVQENSNSFKRGSRSIFRLTVVVLLSIAAFLSLVKLGAVIAAGLRPPAFPTTDAMRRAALESLLSKDKKQN